MANLKQITRTEDLAGKTIKSTHGLIASDGYSLDVESDIIITFTDNTFAILSVSADHDHYPELQSFGVTLCSYDYSSSKFKKDTRYMEVIKNIISKNS